MANCCYMALLLGAHMSGYLRQQRKALPPSVAEDTHRLGLGAMLHDIGKAELPPNLRDKTILDPESNLPEYRYHTLVGFEHVKGKLPATVTHIILHHHQRYDGTGFPDRTDPVSGDRKPAPAGGAHPHFLPRCRPARCIRSTALVGTDGKARPTVNALADLLGPAFRWLVRPGGGFVSAAAGPAVYGRYRCAAQ